MYRFVVGVVVAVLFVPQTWVTAGEKKAELPKELAGTWVRKAGAASIAFTFKKDDLTAVVTAGESVLTVTTEYEVDKDGKVTATITDIAQTGEFPLKPAKGLELEFTMKVTGKTALISGAKAEKAPNLDIVRPFLEGEYEKQ